MMKRTGRITLAFIIGTLAACVFCMPAYADEDGINSIDIDVTLLQDGSAIINESWDINNVYDGTEYYKAIKNLDGMMLSDFSVSDDTGMSYDNIGEWDVDAPFDEKSYKCGVLEKGKGYELCWGISEYGNRKYNISYRLTNFVKAYSDYDGFYYRFLSGDFSSPPDSVKVKIHLADGSIDNNNADTWAFGFDGEIHFHDDYIIAWTDEPLGSSQYVNILTGFNKGFFNAPDASGTFEAVKEKAMNESRLEAIIVIVIASVFFLLIALIVIIMIIAYWNITLADGSKTRRIGVGKAEVNPSIPYGGDIAMTASAARIDPASMLQTAPIAAFIAKWELAGNIRLEAMTDKRNKFGDLSIVFVNPPRGDEIEEKLYTFMYCAAVGEVLLFDKWEEYANDNYKDIIKWEESLLDSGREKLREAGYIAENAKGKDKFTSAGYESYKKVLGFYKFLKGFKSEQSMAMPREFWSSYLTFASLFGLSNSVTDGLQRQYPDDFDDYCSGYNMNTYMFIYFMGHTHTYSDASTLSSSNGDGGSAFSSGGGGFSGGGGGGSR